jgi:hypothetical protein
MTKCPDECEKTKRHPVGKPTNIFPADYRKSDGIHAPEAAGERIGYSDGDAQEEYLLEVVKKASARSLFSRELARSIRD